MQNFAIVLANWALEHKRWKKKLAWNLYQRDLISRGKGVIASSEFEQADIIRALPNVRTIVIPNGLFFGNAVVNTAFVSITYV